jgi:hypothetical protein
MAGVQRLCRDAKPMRVFICFMFLVRMLVCYVGVYRAINYFYRLKECPPLIGRVHTYEKFMK